MKLKPTFMGLFMLCATAFAEAQQPFLLNQTELSAVQKKVAGELDRVYYSLNEEAFEHPEFDKGAHFVFDFGDQTKTFIVTKKKEYLPGYTSIIAKVLGERENTFVFTYSEGRLNGLYHKSHTQTAHLNFSTENEQNYISAQKSVDEKALACGIHEEGGELVTPARQFSNQVAAGKRKSASQSQLQKAKAPIYAAADDSITIDLMLVYTNAAETWASTSTQGNIQGVIAQAMANSQAALDNSNTNINLRLVHTYKTNYNEETDGEESGVRLRRLTQNPANPVFEDPNFNGHMNNVHTLRNQYGADIVSLLVKITDTGGLGWRLSDTGGNPAYGFNLNRVQQVASGYTLIHEIGHNMGNAHSRTQQSNPAEDAGGLHQYSAGYQDAANNFHTVMAYSDGLTQAPIFSSPDLTFSGKAAGTTNVQTPEDNARSMREVKRSIAAYRPSKIDAPLASASATTLEVTMNREDHFSANIDITNTGSSPLVWNADFDFVPQSAGKRKRSNASAKQMKPVDLENPVRAAANYSPSAAVRKDLQQTTEVLYSTSFETEDSFSIGMFNGRSGWQALSDSDFLISGQNPASQNQHLRLKHDGGSTQFMASPFFGYQPFGNYEVSLKFLVSDVSETYDFYIYDGLTSGFSSGVIISNQTIYAADLTETGDVSYFSTSATVSPNVYSELKIIYNTDNHTIDYYFEGSLIAQNDYLAGNTPGVIQVVHRNEVSGAYMDVDDIEVKQTSRIYSWLDAPKLSGVTFENETEPFTLDFNTEGIAAGTYETQLKIYTNDPNKEVINVPVTLTVNDVVSNETEDRPEHISLAQNYPNPFNPATTINYTLSNSEQVRLEVFNAQGQKVATLVNAKQASGKHQAVFDAQNLASGIYVYRLQVGAQTLTRKMVLIK